MIKVENSLLRKILSMIKAANLYNHIAADNIEDAIDLTLQPTLSLSRTKKYISDVTGVVRLNDIKRCYRAKNYLDVINIINNNIGYLVRTKKSEQILLAALSESDEIQRIKFMVLAVLSDVTCLNKVTFSVLLSKLKAKDVLYSSLNALVVHSKLLNHYQRYVLSIYLDYKVEECKRRIDFQSLSDNQKVYLLYIECRYQSLLNLYEEGRLNKLSSLSVNYIFESSVKLKKLSIAEKIFNLKEASISNKNINEYWFAKGDLVKGFDSMRERDMSHVFKDTFRDKYIQSISSLVSDESLLVLASWGPGDDIRYSSMFRAIKSKHPLVTFTCEPRLLSLFSRVYQDINLLPAARTKRVMYENSGDFSHYPHHKIHHVLDEKSIELIGRFDKITLMTDLISEFVLSDRSSHLTPVNFQTKSLDTIHLIDSFVSGLRSSNKTIVGVCWRSMVQSHSRNSHYFSIDELAEIFELDNCIFISLQYDDCSDEIEYINNNFGKTIYIPPIDQMNDFESVLYLLTKIDIVVSAGTAVLEIAGLSGTDTIALVNNESQKYRIQNDKDIWFPNIAYIPDTIGMNRNELISKISTTVAKIKPACKTLR